MRKMHFLFFYCALCADINKSLLLYKDVLDWILKVGEAATPHSLDYYRLTHKTNSSLKELFLRISRPLDDLRISKVSKKQKKLLKSFDELENSIVENAVVNEAFTKTFEILKMTARIRILEELKLLIDWLQNKEKELVKGQSKSTRKVIIQLHARLKAIYEMDHYLWKHNQDLSLHIGRAAGDFFLLLKELEADRPRLNKIVWPVAIAMGASLLFILMKSLQNYY